MSNLPDPPPLTVQQLQVASQAVLGAVHGTCQYRDDQGLAVITMMAATFIHHAARNAGVERSGLMDNFFDRLVQQMHQIDLNEGAG